MNLIPVTPVVTGPPVGPNTATSLPPPPPRLSTNEATLSYILI